MTVTNPFAVCRKCYLPIPIHYLDSYDEMCFRCFESEMEQRAAEAAREARRK